MPNTNKRNVFEWDKGNIGKNWVKHKVSPGEAEEPFFDTAAIYSSDEHHSKTERRYRILGKTKEGRLLFIAFTVRSGRIRIISARDANRKEANEYEKTNTTV